MKKGEDVPMPRRKRMAEGIGISALCTLFLMLFRVPPPFIPAIADVYLGLLISKAMAHPHFYSASDLFVESGKRIPFYIYQLCGFLYSARFPVERLWLLLTPVYLFFLFAAVWWWIGAVIQDRAGRILTLLLLAFLPSGIGGLNWTLLPAYILVSSSFALPVAFAAMGFLFRGRSTLALVMAAAVFYLHPGISFIALFLILAESYWRHRGIRPLLKRAAIAAVLVLPGILNILAKGTQHIGAEQVNLAAHIYHQLAAHAFVEKHFTQGYGWFGLMLMGMIVIAPRARLTAESRLLIPRIWALSFFLMGIYVINLYFFHHLALINLYLFRCTYFLKPLALAVIASGLCRVWRTQMSRFASRKARYAFLGGCFLILASAFAYFQNSLAAEGAVLAGSVFVLASVRKAIPPRLNFFLIVPCAAAAAVLLLLGLDSVCLFHLWPFGADPHGPPPLIFFAYVLGAFNFCLGLVTAAAWGLSVGASFPQTEEAETKRRSCRRMVFLGMTVMIVAECGIHILAGRDVMTGKKFLDQFVTQRYADPTTERLFEWMRTRSEPGSVFVVPPEDERFVPMPLVGERSLWISEEMITQLAYDWKAYIEGYIRLRKMGFVKTPGWDNFFSDSASDYYRLSGADWKKIGVQNAVDYLVMDDSQSRSISGLPVAYTDSYFTVYRFPKS